MNLGEGWNLKLQGFSTLYSQVAINNQSRTDMLKKLFCMDLDWQDFLRGLVRSRPQVISIVIAVKQKSA